MIAHYFAAAVAKFRKTPFTTAANVLTLALGLACFIAAYGIASYWRSADGYHQNAERIFVVGQVNTILGQATDGASQAERPLNAISSWTMAKYLREDFPELERVARSVQFLDMPVAAGPEKAILDMAIADPDFLRLFDFEFVAGDARSALDGPNSVVLTQEAAVRLFGDEPALGRSVLINGADDATVTGVIAPVRQPSFMGTGSDAVLRFDMLRDWASSSQGAQLDAFESWIGITALTYVQLPASLTVEAFNAQLPAFLDRRIPPADQARADTVMRAFPIRELTTFNLNAALFAGSGTRITAVAALLALAAMTLLIACVNYANLATAQATGRGREVGLRKVLGAGRAQVMTQIWLEAMLLTLAGVAAALAVLALAAPAIRASAGVDLLFFLSQGLAPIAVMAGLAAAVALVAGAYPALILSRVRPAEALRSGRSRSGPKVVARVLVGIQFASASFLLIIVTVTQLQRDHIERTALAPRQDPIVVLNNIMNLPVDYDTLAARLADVPGVRSVSVVDHLPWGTSFNGMFFARTPDPAATTTGVFMKSVGYDYFETLNLPLLAGRVFDRERDTTPVSLYAFANDTTRTYSAIIDRRFGEALGFATPQAAVGQVVYAPDQSGARAPLPVEIVGVTETDWSRLGANNGAGVVYTFGPRALFGQQWPVVRIARQDVVGGVAGVTRVWDELAPTISADLRFYDALFEQSFRTYARVSQIFVLLAGAAFLIASIGQLGIAVHVASRRRHEIGVRKTLGSTTLGVVRLLLVDFSKPVLVANLLAWPLAYVAAQIYLQAFDNRVDLTPAPFALSMAITLAIAWAAVLGEVLKAASVRPAEVLRHA